MKPLFCAVLLISTVAPAWSAPGKPAAPKTAASERLFDAPLPLGCGATLHFERTKVAVGAIDNDCHQSDWFIEVRDAKGQPKSGVTLDLPLITKGGQGPTYVDKPHDDAIRVRLSWLPSTKRAPNLANLFASNLAVNVWDADGWDADGWDAD